MIGEPPEWMLWTMFGLMAFIMLISAAAFAPQPPAAAHTPWAAVTARAGSGRILPRMPFSVGCATIAGSGHCR